MILNGNKKRRERAKHIRKYDSLLKFRLGFNRKRHVSGK